MLADSDARLVDASFDSDAQIAVIQRRGDADSEAQ